MMKSTGAKVAVSASKRLRIKEYSLLSKLLQTGDVILSIIYQFIDLKDIVHLGTAITNRHDRALWLELRKCLNNIIVLPSDESVEWCMSRNIHLLKLRFSDYSFRADPNCEDDSSESLNVMISYLAKIGERLISLDFDNLGDDLSAVQFSNIIELCPLLQELHTYGTNMINGKSLVAIGENCVSLTNLDIRFSIWWLVGENLLFPP